MQKRTNIIVCIYGMWGSIEWILPACKYLRDNHDGVEVTFLILRKRRKEIFKSNSELEELTREVTSNECIDLSEFLPCWVTFFSNIIVWLESKMLGIVFRKLHVLWFKLNWRILGKRQFRMWVNRIKPDIAVMDSDNSGIFNELKKQKIKVGFFLTSPSFAFSPHVWLDRDKRHRMYAEAPFDFFLVDTIWAEDFFKGIAKDKSVFRVGCPKFDIFWIDYLKEKFRKSIDKPAGSNFKNILILLKNESSVIFECINFKESLIEMINACLKTKNAALILKPHPRQDIFLLREIISQYRDANITISNEPSFSLITKADIIVAFPNGVIIDALILGRPVIEYFDYPALNKTLRDKFGRIPIGVLGGMGYIEEDGSLTSVFRGFRLVLEANKQDELELLIIKLINGGITPEIKDIRNIFPDNASKKTAEALLTIAHYN